MPVTESRKALAACITLGIALAGSHAAADVSEEPVPPDVQEPTVETPVGELEVVRVSALALGEDPGAIAMPYSILDRESLLMSAPGNIGDALGGLPGVHADSFGGGASRPVIRGQSAPRTKILSDGASILDASDISPDHAVTVDPMLARRIEVLRGPATLLYGSGAVGGVVNILDDKIPSRLPEGGIDAAISARGNSVARERAAAVELTTRLSDRIAFHVEHSTRDADDYRVPGEASPRVAGSAAASANSAIGFSLISASGHVGIAWSHRSDDYGLPGHDHEYASCHPHGASLHCGGHDHAAGGGDDGHDHDHDHEMPPTIDLGSQRFDLRGEYTDPFAGAGRIRFRLSDTDYRHREIEEGEVATTFINRGQEGRIEIEHVSLGNWTGVAGLQHADTTFSADGEESFMPRVDTRSTGVFLVEHYQLSEAWHFELGGRYERLEHVPVDDPRGRTPFKDNAMAYSGAAIWEFAPDYSLTLSAARSERLPHAQELYARGIHLATNTWECGLLPSELTCGGALNDAAIDTETSRNIELTLRKMAGDFTFSLGGFRNDVDNHIHARTLDRFEDFRLIKYTQRDARFGGFEVEATWQFSDAFSATLFGDRVRATFADGGGHLPRIPSARLGARLNGNRNAFGGEIEYYRVARQDRIADHETVSPACDMLNLTLSYTFGEAARSRVFLRGSNLLDERVHNHASFLAARVPLPGRNVTAGFRYAF